MFKKTPLMHSAQARTPRPAPPGPHPYAKPYDSRLTLSKMDSKRRGGASGGRSRTNILLV